MIEEKEVSFNIDDKIMTWQSDDLKTSLFQAQGIDIRITQKKDSYFKSYFPESDNAHNLFAALLRYFHEMDDVPSFESVSSVNDFSRITDIRGDNISARFLKMMYLDNRLPFFEDGVVNHLFNQGEIGGTSSGDGFYGFVNSGNFNIGLYSDSGISIMSPRGEVGCVEPLISLDKGDALNVMRGIFAFSYANIILKELYDSVSP